MKSLIDGEVLKSLGFKEGKAIGLALQLASSIQNEEEAQTFISTLSEVLQTPSQFLENPRLKDIARALTEQEKTDTTISLRATAMPFAVYGSENIDESAKAQMEVAMKLPVSIGGALMPDAHHGYGLPIGGVLATRQAVIPYGVGVDIGCRMALSVLDLPENHFTANKDKYQRELLAWTKFGSGAGWHGALRAEHEVLDSNVFNMNPFIKNLQTKAFEQLGTSGGGNHFVEFGILELENDDVMLGLAKGKYVALLSHSGSRGLGATIAGHYTRLAKELCPLPKEAINLAYLDLKSAEGMEYWMAMNLAGDFASACHDIIHTRLTKALGAQVLAKVENHHNFAWKEIWKGEEVLVHRKGATPAAPGVMGIIPGSMTAPGFLVRGKGEMNSIQSASHGAGRQMSRTQAIKSISKHDMKKVLKDHGVTLLGAGIDEAPMAYKNIETVMQAQKELVDIVAKFTPKLVRMADDGSRED